MSIFNLFAKKESYVGVDIGGGAIKVVELRNEKGRAVLETYGVIEQAMDKGTLIDHPDVLRNLLSTVMRNARVKSKKVMTALPSPLVFTAILNLTGLSEADAKTPEKLAAAIQWEAKKIVPLPLEEMVLDWKLIKMEEKGPQTETLSTQEGQGGAVKVKGKQMNVQVLLIGAAKVVVKKYMDVFKSLGYELIDLDVESSALSRALLPSDSSTVMVVDIGATDAYISIVKNHIALFERTVNFGGNAISKGFAENLKIDINQADQFKVDLTYSNNPDRFKWLGIMKDEMKMVVNEIRYCINLFAQDSVVGNEVEKIMLTGGVALMPGFAEYLEKQLNTKVLIGDPWVNLVYPDVLKPLVDEIGSRFGIAIGLALWAIKNQK